MMMMKMMMNCFYGIVDQPKEFSLISSRDHCQRSSPSRISDTPRFYTSFCSFQNFHKRLSFLLKSCKVLFRDFDRDFFGSGEELAKKGFPFFALQG